MAERLFSCPSDPDPRWGAFQPFTADPLIPLTPDPATPRNHSYEFNGKMAGGLTSGGGEYTGIQISDIRRSSDKFLVQESFMPNGASTVAVIYNANGIPSIVLLSRRHGGKSNMCFADGHLELFDPSILRNDAVSDPQQSYAYLHYIILRAP